MQCACDLHSEQDQCKKGIWLWTEKNLTNVNLSGLWSYLID